MKNKHLNVNCYLMAMNMDVCMVYKHTHIGVSYNQKLVDNWLLNMR